MPFHSIPLSTEAPDIGCIPAFLHRCGYVVFYVFLCLFHMVPGIGLSIEIVTYPGHIYSSVWFLFLFLLFLQGKVSVTAFLSK